MREICEVIRFNVSIWTSIPRVFYNYQAGLIFWVGVFSGSLLGKCMLLHIL